LARVMSDPVWRGVGGPHILFKKPRLGGPPDRDHAPDFPVTTKSGSATMANYYYPVRAACSRDQVQLQGTQIRTCF
jgi:hypothetical protein